LDREGTAAGGVLRLGSLARLRLFEKKYDAILEGLRLLKEGGVKFEYLIGGDGPDREEIERLVVIKGLGNEVRMLGTIENREEFFASIDLMVVATVGYDTGIAGLQALAAGVPIIGYNTRIEVLPDDGRVLRLACAPEELFEAVQSIAATDLYKYWRALCVERQAQIGDAAMIDSYRKLLIAPDERRGGGRPESTCTSC
jgi:glycosyltransferase involved in cell wall biosynthesis